MPRRTWDAEAQARAALLDAEQAHWLVLYGAHSRRFYALAAWPAPAPLIVCGRSVEELRCEMEDAWRDAAADARLADLVRRCLRDAA